jgi:hypothetical protein
VLIVWCVAGELDAEAPAIREPDDEHRLGDPGVLHRGHRLAPQGGLETPSQVLPPVWLGENVRIAAGRSVSARSPRRRTIGAITLIGRSLLTLSGAKMESKEGDQVVILDAARL